MATTMPAAGCLLREELSRPFCRGRRTGKGTTIPAARCLLQEEEKLFGKNFLDISADGRRTGMGTTMPAAGCLPPEEENFIWEELSRPVCGW